MTTTQPNIVIFIADQWRRDYTGIFGPRRGIVQTPHFDALANQGAGFNHCYVTNPICGPSRCSFITGWYPHSRGHRSQGYLIDADEPHLFSYLKRAGYHIAWGGKNDMLTDAAARDSVDTRIRPGPGSQTYGPNPAPADHPHVYANTHQPCTCNFEDHSDVQVVRQAQAFLRNPPAEPFCLLLNLTFPHPPYSAPAPYDTMYNPADMPDPIKVDYDGLPQYMKLLHEQRGWNKADADLVRRMQATYAGMVTMVDDLLGDILKTMTEAGLDDHTALFALSDHGDYTGDYGLSEKWFTACHDVITRVPLAARLPGAKKRGVLDAMVQHIDVTATALDLAGVTPTHTQFGRSLLPLITGETDSGRDAIFVDTGANIGRDTCIVEREGISGTRPGDYYYPNRVMFTEHRESASRTMMVRTDRWKYIWRQCDSPELYDMQNDPHETRNLLHWPSDDTEKIVSQMQQRLLQWFAETGDVLMPPQK